MNIVDALIILFILMGAVIGFKQGAVKRLTSFLGTIIILIVSFSFKNNLSVILYETLPFFDFGGFIKGAEVINILVYEILAFLFIFVVLSFILKIFLVVSGLIETILKMTIFLSIPSKILGIFIGAIEYYIYTFLIVMFLSLPVFKLDILEQGSLAKGILEDTPVLSDMAGDTVEVYSEVYNILNSNEDMTSAELNTEILDILLEYKIVTVDSVEKLINMRKISISDNSILEEYR